MLNLGSEEKQEISGKITIIVEVIFFIVPQTGESKMKVSYMGSLEWSVSF